MVAEKIIIETIEREGYIDDLQIFEIIYELVKEMYAEEYSKNENKIEKEEERFKDILYDSLLVKYKSVYDSKNDKIIYGQQYA